VARIYLLTTTAAGFFGKRGYLPADRDQAPAGIRATREFSGVCPASAAFMVKHLGPSDAVVIFHNPQCGTSRNTLGLIRNAGIEPRIVEYLEHPPAREQLAAMIRAAGLTVRGAMRQKGDVFDELQLNDETLSDDELLDAMMRHPILINRPFVVSDLGTRLCRPSEKVLEILPRPQRGPFTKEDGEIVGMRT
jgi:arsenate reductase